MLKCTRQDCLLSQSEHRRGDTVTSPRLIYRRSSMPLLFVLVVNIDPRTVAIYVNVVTTYIHLKRGPKRMMGTAMANTIHFLPFAIRMIGRYCVRGFQCEVYCVVVHIRRILHTYLVGKGQSIPLAGTAGMICSKANPKSHANRETGSESRERLSRVDYRQRFIDGRHTCYIAI
jgi:hypothetical protein